MSDWVETSSVIQKKQGVLKKAVLKFQETQQEPILQPRSRRLNPARIKQLIEEHREGLTILSEDD